MIKPGGDLYCSHFGNYEYAFDTEPDCEFGHFDISLNGTPVASKFCNSSQHIFDSGTFEVTLTVHYYYLYGRNSLDLGCKLYNPPDVVSPSTAVQNMCNGPNRNTIQDKDFPGRGGWQPDTIYQFGLDITKAQKNGISGCRYILEVSFYFIFV